MAPLPSPGHPKGWKINKYIAHAAQFSLLWYPTTYITSHHSHHMTLHYLEYIALVALHCITLYFIPVQYAATHTRHSECQGPARHLQSICRSWNAIKWAEHQKTSSCRLNWPPSSSGISRPQWLRDFWVVVPRANSSKDVSKIMMLPYYHLSMGFIQQTMGIQLESSYPDC